MEFNIKRFGKLVERDIVLHWRRTLLFTLAIYGALAVTVILVAWTSEDKSSDFHNGIFPYILLIGGFLLTSANFTDFRSHLKRIHYLSLPASNLEKLVSHLIYVTLGYLIFLILSYWLFSSLLNPVCSGIFGYKFHSIVIFSGVNWLLIKLYLVLHALFFVGSISFNRFASIKTILSVIVFTLALLAITAILYRVIFYNHFDGLFSHKSNQGDTFMQNESLQMFFEESVPKIIKNLFWFVMAPLLWVISYFKMIEKEA